MKNKEIKEKNKKKQNFEHDDNRQFSQDYKIHKKKHDREQKAIGYIPLRFEMYVCIEPVWYDVMVWVGYQLC